MSGGIRSGVTGYGGCVRRIVIVVKMQKSRGRVSGQGTKNLSYCENAKMSGGGGGVRSGQGRCVRGIEVIVKMQRKSGGQVGGGESGRGSGGCV